MENKQLMIKPCCVKRFAPVKEAIEALLAEQEKKLIIIAIDGKCASGKTTLGYYLQEVFDCNLFHMDDFFLQNHQRTPKRLEEIGGNVDYERFQKEVLEPIREGLDVRYRPFSCMERKIKLESLMTYKRLNIIEGSYSMHPYFNNPYDLRVFMDIDEKKQVEHIRKRNGEEKLKRFVQEWIPKENAYFEQFHILKGCLKIYFE